MASMTPATALANTWRAAKPMIAAASAPDASTLAASRESPVNCDTATITPISRIPAVTSRRMKRRRVSRTGLTCPRVTASARLRPRRVNARSSSHAARIASSTEAIAVTTSPFSDQKSARGSRTVPAGMAPEPRRAVTLDALGTLLELLPPAPRLRAGLRQRLGVEVSEAEAGRAMRAEIAFYRAHLHLGRDRAGLDALRRGCAEVLRDTLGTDLDLAALTEVLLGAIRFEPFPDAAPALRALRERGVALVAASNWDVSLHEQLERTGLRELLDGALSSAEVGAAKPDPAILARALEIARSAPEHAWHVGDDVEADVGAARAAGMRPVLIDRGGAAAVPGGVLRIASLAELPELCA